MRTKKFSNILIEARAELNLSTETMAFIVGISEQMYQKYERGDWDKTYSVKKDRIIHKLDTLEIQVQQRILELESVRLKLQSKSVKKNVTPHHSKERNLNGKG